LLRKLATVLKLRADSLVALAEKSWRPKPPEFFLGLAEYNTPWHDMTVNAYLVWHEASHEAVLFDTGSDASGALNFLEAHELKLQALFLTHTHGDHILDVDRVKEITGVPAYAHEKEPLDGVEPFAAGRTFTFNGWSVETRRTWGHSAGGITYVVRGLPRVLAVCGDALFAGSMGGAALSYEAALQTNRAEIFSLPDDTILCPGHGPLTTVGEERAFNPFFPELVK
jgi:glyoxylase-like metal-dependent hydrolase (beta-lactamase superfamily II)